MIRHDLAARLRPWREVIFAGLTAVFGIWLFFRGGWFFQPLGVGVVTLAAVWALAARRQMRFQRQIAAPGLVEVVEGAIRLYAVPVAADPAMAITDDAARPTASVAFGGEIALRDLCEIRMLRLSGRQHWRLKAADGQALLIPVDAAGAGALANAFASLPGLDMGRLSAALAPNGPPMQTVWSRSAPTRLT